MLAEAIVLIPKTANKGTEIQMDVLPLVLCKDCKNGYICKDETGQDVVECFKQSNLLALDWFCADGERGES